MMRGIRASVANAAAIFLFALPMTASAEYKTVEHRFIDEWLLVGAVNPSGGGLCMATLMNMDGLTLTFMAEAPHDWSLVLGESSGDWKFKVGRRLPVDYAIDDHNPVSADAVSTTGTDLSILLGKDAAALNPLRHGNEIVLHAAGKTFSFSLAGSARVLDAVADCANQHLGFRQAQISAELAAVDPTSTQGKPMPTKPVNLSKGMFADQNLPDGWRLEGYDASRRPTKSCEVSTFNEKAEWLRISAESPNDLSISISNAEFERQIASSFPLKGTNYLDVTKPAKVDRFDLLEDYDVTYLIDGSPIGVKGQALLTGLRVSLGHSFTATQGFRQGRKVEFRTPFGNLTFSLSGAAFALDALRDCAIDHLGFEDAAAWTDTYDVGSAEGSKDPALEGSIAAAKELRIMQVIFAHDPSAEAEFRDRLNRAVRASGGDKQAVRAEVQAFLGDRLVQAMKAAPSDALAKLARNDRDFLRQLQAKPEACAAFFRLNGRSDFGFLPGEMRTARSNAYADLIEAAMERPSHASRPDQEQMVTWIAEAYVELGFSGDDLASLDKLSSVDDRETCRLGGELMTAVASLSEDRAGEVYRWMVLSGAEP